MNQDQPPGVVITLDVIYAQLVSLTARVDASLARHDRTDQLVAEHATELRALAGAAEHLTDIEVRLRSLERGRWPLASIGVLLPAAALLLSILVAVYGRR